MPNSKKQNLPATASPAANSPSDKPTMETDASTMAKAAIHPAFNSAMTIQAFSDHFGDASLSSLIKELASHVHSAEKGNGKQAVLVLACQAHTLDVVFHNLARRASTAPQPAMAESYLRLALKAQSQCRATLEALSAIKNPSITTFVQQANIGQAVQVNNGPAQGSAEPAACTSVQKHRKTPNKLLERNDGERMDTRTTRTAGADDQELAAVAEIDRATDGARQSRRGKKRL